MRAIECAESSPKAGAVARACDGQVIASDWPAREIFLVVDAAGVVAYCGPAAARLLGLRREAVTGRPLAALIPDAAGIGDDTHGGWRRGLRKGPDGRLAWVEFALIDERDLVRSSVIVLLRAPPPEPVPICEA